MNPDNILKAELLDIIFEKKNKDYGAYTLRKYYNERLYKSLGIIFLVTLVLAVVGIFYKNKPLIDSEIADPWIVRVFEEPVDKPIIPDPPKTPQSTAHTSTSIPVTEQVPVVETHSSTNIVISMEGDKIDPPGSGPQNMPPGDGPQTSGGPASTLPLAGNDPATTIDKTTPIYTAEVMPAFPGGMTALRKFLERNLANPRDIDAGETVTVRIKFIVGYDGVLKGYEIVENGGDAFNNEVIRVLKKMPVWIPGKSHGENVSVFYTIPVIFTSAD